MLACGMIFSHFGASSGATAWATSRAQNCLPASYATPRGRVSNTRYGFTIAPIPQHQIAMCLRWAQDDSPITLARLAQQRTVKCTFS